MSEKKFEKQGRIVTQNPDLLRLLRDKTEESLKQSRFLSENVCNRNNNQNNSENAKRDSYGRYVPKQGIGQPDLDNQSGAKSRHHSGSKVFSVVNPALLRAVGIKPTPEQQANFDSYSPRKNIPSSHIPPISDRSIDNLENTKVDTNNNSSKDITYNNYLAEPSDYQVNYLQEGASPQLHTLQFESEELLKPSHKNSNKRVDSLDPKDSWSDVKGVKSTEPVSSFSRLESNRSRVDLGADIKGTNQKAIKATSQTSMTSNKSPLQRVYIESPTFTQAEEDEYRFVSSRVDDYGDNQDTYRNIQVPAEPPESVSPMKGSKGSRRVHYDDAPEFVDSNRYEDVDESESNTRVINSRQYVLKASESTRSAVSQPSELTVAPRQLPERAPGLGHRLPTGPSYDPDDEDELERETNYQVNLITRIGENTKRVSDLSIPKLPLPLDSDEEFTRDSLDVEDTPHNFVKDSLDLYNQHPPVKGSDQYIGSQQGIHPNQSPWKLQNQTHPPNSYQPHQMVEPWNGQYQDNYSPGYQQHYDQIPTRHPSVQPRFPQQEESEESYTQGDMYMQPIPQQTKSYQIQESPNPAYRLGQSGYPKNEHEYDQHRNNQQIVHAPPEFLQNSGSQPVINNDPRSNPTVNDYPRQKTPHNQQEDHRFQNINSDPRTHHVMNAEPRSHPMNNQDPRSNHLIAGIAPYDRLSQDHYSYGSYQDQGYDYEDDQNYYDDDPTPTNEGTLSPHKQSSRNQQPKVDYIENNRKNYGRVQQKSYKEIQQIKKEEGMKLESRFVKPKAKPTKKKLPNSAPVSNSRPDERYASSPQLNQKQSTVEELWAKKASNLSTKRGPRKQEKLTKFPSDGGLPIAKRKPQDPALTYHSLPPTGFPNPTLQKPLEPITHKLVTEDGQRISVDVNLKLLSPPQSGNNNNLYSQPQAFEDYGNKPGGMPYEINPGYGALGPAYQQDYDGYNYEYYPDQRQDYPSARNYESAPEYFDYSQPVNLPEGRPVSSPYKVIPPIPSGSGSSPTKPINPEDSYVVQYRKQKEKKNEEPWYKIYNLKDYRKMQKEVRLGCLGPDLDTTTHKEKIEKFQRQTDYARMVNERNKKQTVQKRIPSYPRKQESTDDMLSKRKLAVDYSKTIPKPAVKPNPNAYNSYEVSGHIPMGSKLLDSPKTKSSDMDMVDLENLRLRHERDKQNVAVIKQNIELQKA